jgi:hypothetical protein
VTASIDGAVLTTTVGIADVLDAAEEGTEAVVDGRLVAPTQAVTRNTRMEKPRIGRIRSVPARRRDLPASSSRAVQMGSNSPDYDAGIPMTVRTRFVMRGQGRLGAHRNANPTAHPTLWPDRDALPGARTSARLPMTYANQARAT